VTINFNVSKVYQFLVLVVYACCSIVVLHFLNCGFTLVSSTAVCSVCVCKYRSFVPELPGICAEGKIMLVTVMTK